MNKCIKNLLLIMFLCVSIATYAQVKPVKNNVPYNMLMCVDAEQMLNKAGFDNLLLQLFNEKNGIGDEEKAIKIRKAFAAMYGAGIDLDKKVWASFHNGKNEPKDSLRKAIDLSDSLQNRYAFYNFEDPFNNFSYILHIPVANRQVFEKSILDLANTNTYDDAFTAWQKNGNNSYMIKDEAIIALNDKVCMIAYKNYKINSYKYLVPRKIIKVDTVKNEYYRGYLDDDTTTRLDTNYVVDKINEKGEIVRVKPFKRKPAGKKERITNTNRLPPPPSAADAAFAAPAVDTTVSVKPSATRATKPKYAKKPKKNNRATEYPAPQELPAGIASIERVDEPVEKIPEAIATDSTMTIAMLDTIPVNNVNSSYDEYEDTETAYRDSINIITTFKTKRLTPIEQDSIDAIFNKRNQKMQEVFLQTIFQKMQEPMLFDKTSDSIITKMQQSKNDVSFYSDSEFMDNYYSSLGMLYGGIRGSLFPTPFGNGTYETSFNNEPGKILWYANTKFGSNTNSRMLSVYNPINNNWPANFGTRSKAQMQVNINIKDVIAFYKEAYAKTEMFNFEKEMAKKGLSEQEIIDAFTGEAYGYLTTMVSKKAYKRKEGKEEFAGGLALRIKNKEQAVKLMNKLASTNKNGDAQAYYAFEKMGNYLVLIGADDKMLLAEDIAAQMNDSIDTEMLAVQPNELVNGKIDLQGFIKAITGNKETSKLYNYFISQIGNITLNTITNSSNDFINNMEMDMGKNGINPLAVMVEMLRLNNEDKKARAAEYERYNTDRPKGKNNNAVKPKAKTTPKKTIKSKSKK
jgi:hypothetical protein